MKGFLHLVFHVITPVILYIPISQVLKGRERERERGYEIGFDLHVYDLNLSTTLLKLDTVLRRHLGFLKGMFRKDIEPLYVFFVVI